MDGQHSLDHDGERQSQSGGGPWGPAVVRTAIPPGTNLATISSMGPQGPLGSTTAGRILHKFSTIFPHKRNRSLVLLSHSSSMLVTSADADGRVAHLPFTDSWVVQVACSCTTRTMKQKGGTTLPQRQLYHCHLDLTGSAELDCDPERN
jgi:hypothetical protein